MISDISKLYAGFRRTIVGVAIGIFSNRKGNILMRLPWVATVASCEIRAKFLPLQPVFS